MLHVFVVAERLCALVGPNFTWSANLCDSGSMSPSQSLCSQGQPRSWCCALHGSLKWQPASFHSRKHHLDPHAGSNNVTFNATSPVGTVQFPASLGSCLCDVRLRIRLWPGIVFSEPRESMARRAAHWAELSVGSDNYSFPTIQPEIPYHGQSLLGTFKSNAPIVGMKMLRSREEKGLILDHTCSPVLLVQCSFPYLHQAPWGQMASSSPKIHVSLRQCGIVVGKFLCRQGHFHHPSHHMGHVTDF